MANGAGQTKLRLSLTMSAHRFRFRLKCSPTEQDRLDTHTHTHIRIYMSVGTSVSAEYPRQIEVLHQVTVEATTRLGSPRLAFVCRDLPRRCLLLSRFSDKSFTNVWPSVRQF